jgi:hypothetical protein
MEEEQKIETPEENDETLAGGTEASPVETPVEE